MNQNKKIGIASFLIAVVAILGFSFLKTAPTVTTPVVETAQGALSSPDIQSPYISWGNVRQFAYRTENLQQATSTVCTIQSPAATSTLNLGSGIQFTTGSTSASTVVVTKGATPYATTTLLFAGLLSASSGGNVIATTSTNNFVFAPNTYFNVGMLGGTGVFSPTGACQASFTAI